MEAQRKADPGPPQSTAPHPPPCHVGMIACINTGAQLRDYHKKRCKFAFWSDYTEWGRDRVGHTCCAFSVCCMPWAGTCSRGSAMECRRSWATSTASLPCRRRYSVRSLSHAPIPPKPCAEMDELTCNPSRPMLHGHAVGAWHGRGMGVASVWHGRGMGVGLCLTWVWHGCGVRVRVRMA